MKKYIYYIILLFLLIFNKKVIAQNEFCSLNSETPITELNGPMLSNLAPVTIRIFVHAISDPANGLTSVTLQQIYNSVNILQQDFQSCNICFSLHGIDFISSPRGIYEDALLGSQSSFTILDNQYHVQDCINIYIAPDILLTTYAGGVAIGLPGTALLVGGNTSDLLTLNSWVSSRSKTISHEMGHCLGLHHTHHGSGTDLTPGGCPELVNGSNSLSCGDFVADTPADPIPLSACTDANCNLDITCLLNSLGIPLVDALGFNYTPDVHNIMAYSPADCRTSFTSGQCDRALNFIHRYPDLNKCIVTDDLYIQNLLFNSSSHFYTSYNTLTAGENVTSLQTLGPVVSIASQTEFKSGGAVSLMPGFFAAPILDYYFQASIGSICDPITNINAARHSSISSTSTYAPFLNNSKWINSNTLGGHGYINDLLIYYKDTLFNGKVYQMFSDYGIYIPGIYNDPNISAGFKGYQLFREDTVSKKVYKPFFPNSEKLIYDFSLNIGDTLPVSSGIIGTYYLTLIDSALTQVGYRKRFTFTHNPSPFWTVVWVEGIGNISSTTQNFYPTLGPSSVICNYQNDTVVIDQSTFLYPPNQFNCAGIYAGINDVLNNIFEKMEVFPNPFKDEINITTTLYRTQKITIKLYDIYGNLINIISNNENELVGKLEYNFNTEKLKEGVYLCLMESEFNKIVKKIIKIN